MYSVYHIASHCTKLYHSAGHLRRGEGSLGRQGTAVGTQLIHYLRFILNLIWYYQQYKIKQTFYQMIQRSKSNLEPSHYLYINQKSNQISLFQQKNLRTVVFQKYSLNTTFLSRYHVLSMEWAENRCICRRGQPPPSEATMRQPTLSRFLGD